MAVFRIVRGTDGITLATVLPLLLVILVFVAAGLRLTNSGMRFSALRGADQRALYVADGALQDGMARLHFDRYTAGAETTYAFAASGAIQSNPYSYQIQQDPAFPSDPTRKEITALGVVDGVTSAIVSQVSVYPYSNPGLVPPSGDQIPTCDWAIFANRGVAQLISTVGTTTDRINGNVHSNNRIHLRSTAGATIRGDGTFQSVGDTLTTTDADVLANMSANLFRGGSFVITGPHSHVGLLPTLGIHFNNGFQKHGVQQSVAEIGFPLPDWKMIEQDPTVTIVEEGRVPFGTWNTGTDTWVVTGIYILPSEATTKFIVRGNASFQEIKLARETDGMIAARGTIEIRELSLLQSNGGGNLAVGLNSTQTIRLIGESDVFVGRGLAQSETAALNDTTQGGINLSSAVTTTNRVAAYSQRDSVWTKSSSITALTSTKLNLVADQDSTFAVTGTIASSPTGFCQRVP